jgi:acyl-coenzyme A synthetase/AMP-(fatty) acid ligase
LDQWHRAATARPVADSLCGVKTVPFGGVMSIISKPFLTSLALFKDTAAIHTATASYSYAQLYNEIEVQCARLARAGVAPGSIVLVQGDYSFSGIALFLALYQNNNIIAMNTSTNQREVDDKTETANAAYFADLSANTLERRSVRDVVPPPLITNLRAKGQAGLILFSSGTSGKPKAMLYDLDTLIDGYQGRRARPVNMLLFLLFDHIGGINTLLNILAMGGNATLVAEKTPQHVASLIERFSISILPTSPTFLNMMLMSGVLERHDLSALRMITYGTEPMPDGLLLRLRQQLPRVTLLQTFGTSETGIVNTTSKSSDSLYMKFNDTSTEHKVVEGELWLRSSRQILGYLNHASDSFTEDGWFKTGDMVEEGKDGYLRIRGRSKEIINVGGEKVFPVEIESVLLRHPMVIDCKAYGEANGLTGQFVSADIVLDPTCQHGAASVLREIRVFASQSMDSYKVPVRLKAVSDIAYSARFKKVLLGNGQAEKPPQG